MALEIFGKLIQLNPVITGSGQRGEWKKREMIIETSEQYPKKICILCWNDKAERVESLPVGSELKVSINIESREYNGRWYTDVRAWNIEQTNSMRPTQPAGEYSSAGAIEPKNQQSYNQAPADAQQADDLPF